MPRQTFPVISADAADVAAEANQAAKPKKLEPVAEAGGSGIAGDVIEAAVNVIGDLLSDS